NYALSKVKTEWVLFLDADERVPPELSIEIKLKINDGAYNAFKVRRNDHFLNRLLQYGETGNWNQVRLAKVTAGKWTGLVHETWKIKGSIGQLETPLNHYPHPTIDTFLRKINFYTTLRA